MGVGAFLGFLPRIFLYNPKNFSKLFYPSFLYLLITNFITIPSSSITPCIFFLIFLLYFTGSLEVAFS